MAKGKNPDVSDMFAAIIAADDRNNAIKKTTSKPKKAAKPEAKSVKTEKVVRTENVEEIIDDVKDVDTNLEPVEIEESEVEELIQEAEEAKNQVEEVETIPMNEPVIQPVKINPVPEVVVAQEPVQEPVVRRVGRPRKQEESERISLYIPKELLEKIDAISPWLANGNRSQCITVLCEDIIQQKYADVVNQAIEAKANYERMIQAMQNQFPKK